MLILGCCQVIQFKNILKNTFINLGLYSLSSILGITFICSAFLKFLSIDLFELNLVESGFIEWALARWIALLIIGFELFLGILIILNLKLHGFTLWLSMGLLAFFTVYLFIILLTKGNRENCHCFGSFFILSPFQSLLKNSLLMILNLILIRYHKDVQWKYPKLIVIGTIIIAFLIPFTVDSLNSSVNKQIIRDPGTNKINLDLLYGESAFIKPSMELRKGKQIVAFLSMTCPYCLITAYKFYLIKKENSAIPIFFILSGKKSDIPQFLAETRSYNIPHLRILKQDFVKLVGTELPVILYLNDGIIVKKINFLQINQKDIENWIFSGMSISQVKRLNSRSLLTI